MNQTNWFSSLLTLAVFLFFFLSRYVLFFYEPNLRDTRKYAPHPVVSNLLFIFLFADLFCAPTSPYTSFTYRKKLVSLFLSVA